MALSFEALTPSLLVARCGGLFMNTGILHEGSRAALIDPALLPSECREIAAVCRERQLVVESVVLTHHDWDHVVGAAFFPGARIVAHRLFSGEVQAGAERIRAAAGRYFAAAGITPLPQVELPVPRETVDRILPLMVGGLRVLLVQTPGHAPDHLSIYDADTACLWAGDLLSDREIPMVSGRLDAYERTLAMLAGMEIRMAVPGHGAIARDAREVADRIAWDRAYLAGLRRCVEVVVAAQGTVQEAQTACAGLLLRSPADRPAHSMNVEQVFLECGGRVPPGTALGWARET